MNSEYYYVELCMPYEELKPSPKQSLIDLYNLNNIANSVARVNPDGSKGIKLRKSYKSHIADLPGKYANLPEGEDVSKIVFKEQHPLDNTEQSNQKEIKQFDMNFLLDVLKFDKSPESGIPDFDPANLAVSDSSKGNSAGSNGEGDSKKRKKKDINGDDKRRKLS